MYKTKVWIYKNKVDARLNEGGFWVDYTFVDEPINNNMVTVVEDLIVDIQDDLLWKKEYGPGNYVILKAKKMFSPDLHSGFTHSAIVYKVE